VKNEAWTLVGPFGGGILWPSDQRG